MEVIKVVPKRPGIIEQIQEHFSELPGWAKVGVIAAAPVTVAAAVAVGAEAAVVAGGALIVTALAGTVNEPHSVVERLHTPDEVADLVDHSGNNLAIGQRYVRHPRKRNMCLLTEDYHYDIAREQQRQLTAFIRSQVAVSRLQIEISYDDAQDAEVRPSLFGVSSRKQLSGSILCDLNYDTPEIVPTNDDLFWLDHFSNVKTGLRYAGRGRKNFIEKFGKNLSCDVRIAEKFGFKAEACRNYALTILIEG